MCSRQILVSMKYGWRSGHLIWGQELQTSKDIKNSLRAGCVQGRSGFSKASLLKGGGVL